MPTPKKTAAPAVPPADAVALDAHWAAKMERLRNRQLAERPFRIFEDEKTRDDYNNKRARALRMRHIADEAPRDKDAQANAEAAEADAQAADEAFTAASEVIIFRQLPRPVYEALVKAHPPTEEQAAEGADWNSETFAPALVSASAVDPMTVEDATELLGIWGSSDANDLYNAAFAVQLVHRSDLGKG